jgi:hypothetical protein
MVTLLVVRQSLGDLFVPGRQRQALVMAAQLLQG